MTDHLGSKDYWSDVGFLLHWFSMSHVELHLFYPLHRFLKIFLYTPYIAFLFFLI